MDREPRPDGVVAGPDAAPGPGDAGGESRAREVEAGEQALAPAMLDAGLARAPAETGETGANPSDRREAA